MRAWLGSSTRRVAKAPTLHFNNAIRRQLEADTPEQDVKGMSPPYAAQDGEQEMAWVWRARMG